jgi:hypothetical protein
MGQVREAQEVSADAQRALTALPDVAQADVHLELCWHERERDQFAGTASAS